MSPERDDEMPAEFDMSGGVRGKYVERYRRWASKHGITAATGAVEVCAVTSSGGSPQAEIVLPHLQDIYGGPVLQEQRPMIALKESAVPANAL